MSGSQQQISMTPSNPSKLMAITTSRGSEFHKLKHCAKDFQRKFKLEAIYPTPCSVQATTTVSQTGSCSASVRKPVQFLASFIGCPKASIRAYLDLLAQQVGNSLAFPLNISRREKAANTVIPQGMSIGVTRIWLWVSILILCASQGTERPCGLSQELLCGLLCNCLVGPCFSKQEH